MSVTMTILADRPSQVAEVYQLLAEHLSTVAIEDDDVVFEFVIGDEAIEHALAEEHEQVQDPYGELTPEQEAQVEEVLSHPIYPEGPWDDAEEAPRQPEVDSSRPLTKQIAALLNAQPDKVWTSPMVAEHVDGTTGTISTAMAAMAKDGRITKVARGQYQAIDRSALHDARRQAAAAGMFGG